MGEVKDWIFLIVKSIFVIIGGILFVAALVDLVVGGFTWLTLGVLVLGLALWVPPMAFAYRDAVREAKKGRI